MSAIYIIIVLILVIIALLTFVQKQNRSLKKAKEEAARQVKEEAERRAKEEAARQAKEEAERRAKEEAARQAKEEAERQAKEEAARQAKEEAERQAKEEAARQAKEEAERQAKEEAARQAKEETARQAKIEADSKVKKGTKYVSFEKVERPNDIFDRDNSSHDRFLAHLNDNQKSAVLATEGRIKVVAGAGSGKTRVLVNRFAYLVEELGVNPSNILCITFTNKAAQEMKNRIGKLVQAHNVNDFVCTIHGFCVKFLRAEIHRIGYPKNFIIVDEEDSKSLAKQVMSELELDRTDVTVKQFLSSIGMNKIMCPYVKKYIVPGFEITEEDQKSDFVRYLSLQKKYFALDFNDLIQFTLYILDHFEEVREKWARKFNYIQVDEVQDCNQSDWSIIYNLATYYGNLFIVGDPDQAIYEWRGSLVDDFVKFKADTEIILNENYRSTPNILNVANSIIHNNENRVKKDLITKKPSEKIVVHAHTKTEPEEGSWIAKQIKNLVKNGANYSDFAILYRASYLSRNIEQSLLKMDIPYTIWGGIRFFERKEIKDCIAYLRLVDAGDDISFKRIINVPSRKFGKVTMDKLISLSESENTSLYDTLKKHITEKPFNKEEFSAFIDLIESAREKADVISISDLLEYLLVNSGLKELYRIDEDEERLENISELSGSIKYYEHANSNEEITLNKYLQDIALYTNADYKEELSSVKLMTIHQSKGLEFPFVFIIGLTEGVFPSHKSIRERKKKGLEEERRLMYVAVTRAERMLFLTESEGFNMISRTDKYPSRFIYEISDNLVEVDGNLDPQLFALTKSLVRSLSEELGGTDTYPLKYSKGDFIEHKVFGFGKILSINDKDRSYRIQFEDIARYLTEKSILPANFTEQQIADWNERIENAERLLNLKKENPEEWKVDDIVSLNNEKFVVRNKQDGRYILYSFNRELEIEVSDRKQYGFVFRPKNDAFYLVKNRFRQDDSFFYVKKYYFTKDDIMLSGIMSDLGIRQELTTFWLNRLFEVTEKDFLDHCSDSKAFIEFRKEK